jgi:Uma2 family endonuclease
MQHHHASPELIEGGVMVLHRVPSFSDKWLIGEPVPEAAWHDRAVELLKALLEHWLARTRRDAAVFRNLAVRVRSDKPKVGFDPDLMVVSPAPPGARDLSSLRLWMPGHAVPSLVVEVVSPGHPYKDYAETPDLCAALGVDELLVFDPTLVGPKALGGPQRLQLWRRTDARTFERVYSGEGPSFSPFLGAYLSTIEEGRRLRIADDESGRSPWLTPEEAERDLLESERAATVAEREAREQERAAKEQERAAKEQERAAKEQALARVAELERELGKRRE